MRSALTYKSLPAFTSVLVSLPLAVCSIAVAFRSARRHRIFLKDGSLVGSSDRSNVSSRTHSWIARALVLMVAGAGAQDERMASQADRGGRSAGIGLRSRAGAPGSASSDDDETGGKAGKGKAGAAAEPPKKRTLWQLFDLNAIVAG